MAGPPGWNARTAIARLNLESWSGHAWRFHQRRYEALNSAGSLLVSGRYNRGSDQFPEDQAWAALYLALRVEVAVGEIVRHITPGLLRRLNDFRLSEIKVELGAVLDCRDPAALGLIAGDLIRDYDLDVTQELAGAAIARDTEGTLVSSATGLGDNLVIFPARRRPTSRLVIVDSRDPQL